MSTIVEAHEQQALDALRARLPLDRPTPLRPELAFMYHVLLASVVHNAARLTQHAADSQGGAWIRYITSYFPAGRNSEQEAKLLWTDR